ncbi:MAG: hypothetical protein KME23_23290 [Goleter apudmare HA4340-LM2]|jgi:hypothetical protein|nr:hypothetical protein [Goleter apudmare HA4340-LM2]
MSKRNSTIAGAAILILAIAGCASESTPEATIPSPEATNPSPNAALVKKSPQTIQSFNNPVVAAKNVSQVPSKSPNLIQPTNATERADVVLKGRNDPFAQIIGQTVIEVPDSNAKPVPNLPPLPIAKAKTVAGKLSQRSAVISGTLKATQRSASLPATRVLPAGPIPILPSALPPVVPSPNLVSLLPQSAQPDLAKAVVVSGVVLLGNKLQAIIKVPNEPTSRYVQAGQRLANGLLIKRIEMNEGSNPVVIVEQYGIEVARMVGDAPSATDAAANPVSVTTPPQSSVSTAGAS